MKMHFIGIGGIGVSALATYYLKKGHEVSGSDLVASEITDNLKKAGAKIIIGPQKSENLPKNADFIIYSPAAKKDNPELLQAEKYKLKIKSYPEALGELTEQYFTIAVSGTHGKSTTTAMLGLLLTKAGLNPTVILGTKLKEFGNSNCRVGGYPKLKYKIPRTRAFGTVRGGQNTSKEMLGIPMGRARYKILVIEADEHFASFLNYWPKIIVLTNIEADHLDYYKNLGNILKTFKEYIGHLSKQGVLVANGDDANISKITRPQAELILNQRSKVQFKSQKYSLKQPEAKILEKILKVPGEHNISNALAALSVARILKIADKISFKALSEYRSSWRRFEEKDLKIANCKLKIISDYGHHPTEIRATLKAAREKYPKKKIWCVFQPHQYQRTYYLFDDFVKVFKNSPIDNLIITDIYDVAGREEKEIKQKVSAEKLAKAVKRKNVIYLPKKNILNYLKKNLRGGEVLIIMGAGDIYDLTKTLLDGKF